LLEAHILTFDTFRFDTALDIGNFDTITDFSSATDTIQLDDDVFTNLGQGPGGLEGIRFKVNAAGVATDLTDRVIYETDTGILRYDSNGSLAGGVAAFARLTARRGKTEVHDPRNGLHPDSLLSPTRAHANDADLQKCALRELS
jgi:hypothetical protein